MCIGEIDKRPSAVTTATALVRVATALVNRPAPSGNVSRRSDRPVHRVVRHCRVLWNQLPSNHSRGSKGQSPRSGNLVTSPTYRALSPCDPSCQPSYRSVELSGRKRRPSRQQTTLEIRRVVVALPFSSSHAAVRTDRAPARRRHDHGSLRTRQVAVAERLDRASRLARVTASELPSSVGRQPPSIAEGDLGHRGVPPR